MKPPICTIVAGPNGAGKTTFALRYLPEIAHCQHFVNADLIAAGLSPLSPEREWLTAGRLFLTEVRQRIERREDFAFESTLSGRIYLRLIRELLNDAWQVHLYYLWLPNVEMSVQRVAERVAHGGHDIPLDTITRRYRRSVANFLNHYTSVCNSVVCFDNAGPEPVIIFTQVGNDRMINDQSMYNALIKEVENE